MRSTGHIGSLMELIRRGCVKAIRTGAETLNSKVFDSIKIDGAAEKARKELALAFRTRRLTTRPTRQAHAVERPNDAQPMGPRTLPIRVAPVPGEALDSWPGALAQRLDTSWGDLLAAILPPTNRASVQYANLTAYLHTAELSAISAATGIWPATVEGLTLSRYEGHSVTVDRSARRLHSLPWPPIRSRFCPMCLLRSDGRWQLAWRLPWAFVCQEHSRASSRTPARPVGNSNAWVPGGRRSTARPN